MKIRMMLFTMCVVALLFTDEAMAGKKVLKKVVAISGEYLRVIRVAIYEADKKNYPFEKGDIEVFESSETFTVLLGSLASPKPGERGNFSGSPILVIELKKKPTYEVLRADYLR